MLIGINSIFEVFLQKKKITSNIKNSDQGGLDDLSSKEESRQAKYTSLYKKGMTPEKSNEK